MISMCFVLVQLSVQTSPLETYARGKELFEAAYYEDAAPLLRLFVEDPDGAPASKITSARWMLAQALFFTGDTRGAAKQVRAVIGKGVPADLPPRFAAFVEEQRPKASAKPSPSLAPQRSIEPPPPSLRDGAPFKGQEAPSPSPQPPPAVEAPSSSPDAPAVVQPAPVEVIAQPPMPRWYVRGLPFGLGHLIAKDYVGGSVFLALTLGAVAANVALLILNTRARFPDGSMPAQQFPLYVAQHVTAGAFYGLLAASVIDGIVFVPKRVAGKWAP